MTEEDLSYIQMLLDADKIKGPVLELGAGYGGSTCRDLVSQYNLSYSATDILPSPGVNYVADFSSAGSMSSVFEDMQFGSVLVLNVLEHTFDPIRVLDNALELVKKGGRLIVITPAIWTLHNYPVDCCRLLPDWYEQYASSRNVELSKENFNYIGYGTIDQMKDGNGNYKFPPPCNSKRKYWTSRIIQKIFNTYGRGMAFPSHVAIGAYFIKDLVEE